ncbi:response regulator [Magnetospirillum gryphiswaldense]|uniref:response regulator n=1 Tax=Magnetospirillum gryphiswaldense TaxID=55518 RepID=UPI0005A013D9|nr:response regulator [Magnetospirillum gryphiswaldense]
MQATSKIKVLLVDDSVPYSHFVREAILQTKHECEIELAHNGLEALEKLKLRENTDEQYDIVITDLNMPIMSGFDLIRAIRQSHTLRNLAVAAISSQSRSDISKLILALGADTFFEKKGNMNSVAHDMDLALQKLVLKK